MDGTDCPLLLLAIKQEKMGFVQMLISAGADVNIVVRYVQHWLFKLVYKRLCFPQTLG